MFVVDFLKKKMGGGAAESDNMAVGRVGIGTLVSIDRPFLLVQTDSFLSDIVVRELAIVAIGRVTLGDSNLTIHRFYLNDGSASLDHCPSEMYLQRIEQGGEINYSLHKLVHRTFPQDDAELSAYQGKGYGLGETEFTIGDIEWVHFSPPSNIAEKIKTEDGILYLRDLNGGVYVPPIQASEELMFDSHGLNGALHHLGFVPYYRNHEKPEKLDIALLTGDTFNGDQSDACYVNFHIGIDVPESKINFY